MNTINLSRRKFLQGTAIAGGGLLIGFSLGGCSRSGSFPITVSDGGFVPNAFLQLTPDNTVYFYSPSDEMGQGVLTGLATVIGEELDYSPLAMRVSHAPGVHPDYRNPEMGVQATGGSNAIKAFYEPLRQVGANTRALLVAAAASELAVAVSEIRTEDGHVIVKGERHPYGRFVAAAAAMSVPQDAPLKPPSEFRYIGKVSARVDALEKSTGTGDFGMDASVPGMRYAVVVRSPVAGAKLKSLDRQSALQVAGVSDVLEISSGVAIVADRYWQARQGAASLKADWESVPLAKQSTETIRAELKAALDGEAGVEATDEGDIDAGFSEASQVLESEYWAPFLAHAPMEPLNALLKIDGDRAEIWTGAQSVMGVQGLVARVAGIDAERVKVNNLYLGGGFGRRGTLTHIVEVTEIVKAVKQPVKLVWSREDDIRNGLYRPASLMRIRAGLGSDGKISAWHARRAGGNLTPTTWKNMLPAVLPAAPGALLDAVASTAGYFMQNWVVDHSSVEGLHEDYGIANKRVEHVSVEHGLPLTFWRSVGHSYTAFAVESMIDELALAAGVDPVELRLRNTGSNPRLHNVIRVAGKQMKAMQVPAGHQLGFAAHGSFDTDVAQIAEVSIDKGRIRVHKVTCVIDCGTVVNPDIVRAQMESAVMFGLTAALHGELHLENGAIRESNFHDYPILRMNEAPDVEVIIVDSKTAPTGVGEPGLPPLAPAVANAVYRASGQRLRELPLRLA